MPTYNGDNGDNVFNGGSEDDIATGNGGNDTLSGGGGNDQLVGSSGADILNGDEGDDRLASYIPTAGATWVGGSNDIFADVDTLNGGAGHDLLHAGFGDFVDGGTGTDYLHLNLRGAATGVTADFRLSSVVLGGGTITNIEGLSVEGSNFDDNLIASSVTDQMNGGSGNDILDARASIMASLEGGTGNDTLYVNAAASTVAYGGDGDDTIYSHGEVHGGAGNDTIIRGASSDATVYGDAGDDSITGSDGDDRIEGGAGADVIQGGGGDDELASHRLEWSPFTHADAGIELDQLSGGDGSDLLSIGYGDSADGGSGTDRLALTLLAATAGVNIDTTDIISGQVYLLGGGTIQGVEGIEHLTATNYNDTLTIAGQGSELISVLALNGDDTITSLGAEVSVRGDEGDDRFVTDGSGDSFDGGNGFDTIDYSLAPSGLTIDLAAGGPLPGGDFVSSIEHYSGSNHADILIAPNVFAQNGVWLSGAGGNDTLTGSNSGDTLNGGAGDDMLDGGPGFPDTASYAGASAGVMVDLSITTAQDTLSAGFDTLTSIENLTGSSFADTLRGNSAHNRIAGGLGADTLAGGGGIDYFLDTAAGLNGDTITDLSADDLVVLYDVSAPFGFTFAFTQDGNTVTWAGGSFTSEVSGQFQLTTYNVGFKDNRVAFSFIPDAQRESDPNNDFNGDGRSDVLWRQDGGALGNWLGTSGGGFTYNNAGITQVPNYWQIAGTGDFNGDGHDDILWRGEGGEVGNWLANRDGNFAYNAAAGITAVPNVWQIAGVADFNDDGREDILWRHQNGTLGNWLATEAGGYEVNQASIISVPTDWHVVGLGDFDGDGHNDILWQHDSGLVGTWRGTGDGTFTVNPELQHATTDWHVVGVGDFNGDGHSDILWRSEGGLVANWLGTEGATFNINNASVVSAPTTTHIVEVGDFNGDEIDDLLWHSDNGDVTIWRGQDDGLFAPNEASLIAQHIGDWTVQSPEIHWI